MGSGGGRSLPLLLEVMDGRGRAGARQARARLPELRESVVLLRLEVASEHGIACIPVEVWRRSRPVEDGRSPGVHQKPEGGEQPEQAVQGAPRQRQEHDQTGREAVPELA